MGTVMRNDTSQRSHRLAVTQPVHPSYHHHYPFTENCWESALDMVRRACDDREFGDRTDADEAP